MRSLKYLFFLFLLGAYILSIPHYVAFWNNKEATLGSGSISTSESSDGGGTSENVGVSHSVSVGVTHNYLWETSGPLPIYMDKKEEQGKCSKSDPSCPDDFFCESNKCVKYMAVDVRIIHESFFGFGGSNKLANIINIPNVFMFLLFIFLISDFLSIETVKKGIIKRFSAFLNS